MMHRFMQWIQPRRFLPGITGLLLVTSAAAETVTLDRIVAVVNEEIILQSELDYRRRLFLVQQADARQQFPTPEALDRQLLELLIASHLQLQIARQESLAVDDAALDEMLVGVAERNGLDMERFRLALEQDGFEFGRFREDMREEMLLTRLRSSRVDNQVEVSDHEIEHFLTTMEHQGESGDEYLLAHILIAIPDVPGTDVVAVRQQALDVLGQLQQPEADFMALARQYSDASNAVDGGLMEWRGLSDLPDRFVHTVPEMEVGEVRGLLEDSYGYHIVKLVDRRRSLQLMVSQVRARHILLRVDDIETQELVQNRLAELHQRINEGEDFAALAAEYSQDIVTSLQGGELGWISAGQLAPDFERFLETLQPEVVSEPFESSMGWHLVEVLERREIDNTDALLRSRARELIRKRKVEEARRNWLRQLRDEAYIEYRLRDTPDAANEGLEG